MPTREERATAPGAGEALAGPSGVPQPRQRRPATSARAGSVGPQWAGQGGHGGSGHSFGSQAPRAGVIDGAIIGRGLGVEPDSHEGLEGGSAQIAPKSRFGTCRRGVGAPTWVELGLNESPPPAGIDGDDPALGVKMPGFARVPADGVRWSPPAVGAENPGVGSSILPCPPFLSPAKRRTPALRLAFRHVGSRELRGMPCNPLGPFLIADWVPVWVPVFGGDPARVRGCRRPSRRAP
jgi:hypothetical protein